MNNFREKTPVRQVFISHDLDKEKNYADGFCPKCGKRNNLYEQGGSIHTVCSSCGFVTYRNPFPGVSVLIENRGMVLLGRRIAGSFAGGLWCLPCGFVEYDEDILTAAKRETFEETGLTIELQSIIQVTSNFHSRQLHSIVTVFLAHVKDGIALPGDDIDKIDWFPLAGPFPPFAFEADEEIITRYSLTKIPGLPLEESAR